MTDASDPHGGSSAPSSAPSSSASASGNATTGREHRQQILACSDEALQKLLQSLDRVVSDVATSSLKESVDQSSVHLLMLKQCQRSMCRALEYDLMEAAREGRRRVESKTLALQNLTYERDYLRQEIQKCRSRRSPQLAQMVAAEESAVTTVATMMGKARADGGSGGGVVVVDEDDASTADSEDARIDAFLARRQHDDEDGRGPPEVTSKRPRLEPPYQYCHRDLGSHGTTLEILQREVRLRAQAELQVKKAKAEGAKLRRRCKKKRDFLEAIPRHLAEVERATQPLQSFFGFSQGSERRGRLQRALQLQGPLYTLFYQLQSHLDAEEAAVAGGDKDMEDFEDEDGEDIDDNLAVSRRGGAGAGAARLRLQVELSEEDGEKSKSPAVLLRLKVPRVRIHGPDSAPSPKKAPNESVVIFFSYSDTLRAITAQITDGSEWSPHLLHRLFPLQEEEDTVEATAHPYRWCQALGGLQPLPSSPPKSSTATGLAPSTRVIVRQLQRRLRARATLHELLVRLLAVDREPRTCLFLHPTVASSAHDEDDVVELTAFTEVDGGSKADACRYFVATLTRQGAALQARVQVDPAYPGVPPLWSLQPPTEAAASAAAAASWGEVHGSQSSLHSTGQGDAAPPPLYDAALGQLEAHVNAACWMEDLDSDAYDYILVQQLAQVAQGWEELQRALEVEQVAVSLPLPTSLRRGRDRQLWKLSFYAAGL